MDRDQRRHRREQIECLILIGRSRAIAKMATVMDLSVGGIRFQCMGLDIQLGDRLRAQLTLGHSTIEIAGTVRRIDKLDAHSAEVGLEFSRSPKKPLEALRAFLEQIREESGGDAD